MKIIQGYRIYLRPMTLEDKNIFFEWATNSESTPDWYGEKYKNSIPSKKEFFEDWNDFYFTDDHPKQGRCFVIVHDDEEVGQVNYNSISDGKCELDIIIPYNQHKGRGYGVDAIKTLYNYLFQKFHLTEIEIFALQSNYAAISTYQKSGFSINKLFKDKEGLDWAHLILKNLNK